MSLLVVSRVSVPRLWPGERVVIIGGGSSLTPEDVNACHGRARILAIKEAIQLAPWADALYAADAKWWRHYQGVPTFDGLKYAIAQDPRHPLGDWVWPADIQVLENTGVDGLELEPTGLRTGYHSGYQAINLAYHLAGATTIVLLGFDCWSGPDGRQNWFTKPGLHVDSPYPLFLQAYHSIAPSLRVAGVTVLNASRFTVLTTFPRVSLAEALA